ncbi:hypothetical protein P154DRAFT_206546 [Amniculicola lignicola CBS 123094]|uniref:Uncharacterized protein n=1 Tax=Amniculicola lignicola CBS 123094 TaxID=1392246 RepID=A0A6A5WR03_9PLEO|nr:hypothetical protein P154DRAFT_206546 [Amniculicola lignicola CBS 123094]
MTWGGSHRVAFFSELQHKLWGHAARGRRMAAGASAMFIPYGVWILSSFDPAARTGSLVNMGHKEPQGAKLQRQLTQWKRAEHSFLTRPHQASLPVDDTTSPPQTRESRALGNPIVKCKLSVCPSNLTPSSPAELELCVV